MSWTTSEGLNEQYSFFNDMMEGYHRAMVREKRFVISGPIAIATAIGILSATSAVSASYKYCTDDSVSMISSLKEFGTVLLNYHVEIYPDYLLHTQLGVLICLLILPFCPMIG